MSQSTDYMRRFPEDMRRVRERMDCRKGLTPAEQACAAVAGMLPTALWHEGDISGWGAMATFVLVFAGVVWREVQFSRWCWSEFGKRPW